MHAAFAILQETTVIKFDFVQRTLILLYNLPVYTTCLPIRLLWPSAISATKLIGFHNARLTHVPIVPIALPQTFCAVASVAATTCRTWMKSAANATVCCIASIAYHHRQIESAQGQIHIHCTRVHYKTK